MSTAQAADLGTRAEVARDAGRLDEAVTLYRKALAARAHWREGWWALGTILYDRDQYGEAADAFARLVALDARNGTAHLMLALCEYQLDRNASALEHVLTAKRLGVQKDNDLPRILVYHEGMLFLRAGQYERALDALQPLVETGTEDENLDLALGLGVLLTKPPRTPRESDSYQRWLQAGRAERFKLTKQFDRAAEAYRALVDSAPSLSNAHYAYGRFLLETGDLDDAVAAFERELARQPDHIRARMQIGAARHRLDPAAGIPVVAEVVRLAPRYPFGHFLLGLLYLESGDAGRALPELEIAARMVPDDAQFQFALGRAYAGVGRKDDAARARAAFVRLNGNATPASRLRLDLDPEPSPRR